MPNYNIYKTIEKIRSILSTDLQTLLDKSSLIITDIEDNQDEYNKEHIQDSVFKNSNYLKEAVEIINTINDLDEIYSSKNMEDMEILTCLLNTLIKFDMIDISYGAKGKIILDFKHISGVEDL